MLCAKRSEVPAMRATEIHQCFRRCALTRRHVPSEQHEREWVIAKLGGSFHAFGTTNAEFGKHGSSISS